MTKSTVVPAMVSTFEQTGILLFVVCGNTNSLIATNRLSSTSWSKSPIGRSIVRLALHWFPHHATRDSEQKPSLLRDPIAEYSHERQICGPGHLVVVVLVTCRMPHWKENG